MSSPEPQQSALIPAGLPMAYVGGWAAIGLASLVYLGVVTKAPQILIQEAPQSQVVASVPVVKVEAKHDRGPAPPALDERPQASAAATPVEPPEAAEAARPVQTEVAATEAPAADPAPTDPFASHSGTPVQQVKRAFEIDTRYVTTQQILAARESLGVGTTPEVKSPSPATSNIVTGSITVPPPPERGPPRPAVVRTALKPKVEQKPAATKAPAAKAGSSISFGPAVVTESASEVEPPALAILLASGSSVESLRLTWNLLQERHAAALQGLNPRYIVQPNPSAPDRKFVLLAGPVVSATEVARVCSILVSEGLDCRTRSFAGNSL